jgi:hypothetical protein
VKVGRSARLLGMHLDKGAAPFAVRIGDPGQTFFRQIAAGSVAGESIGKIGEGRHSLSPMALFERAVCEISQLNQ